jgi:hypothetical protein
LILLTRQLILSWPYKDRPLLTHSKISLSSRTPLLSFTLLSPIIGAIKVISFLLIVESSFHRLETKRHHRHLIDETCSWLSPATYPFRKKCQASNRKNSDFLHPGIHSKYRSSQPPDFNFLRGNGSHESTNSQWRWAAPWRKPILCTVRIPTLGAPG